MRRSFLEGMSIAGRDQADATSASYCRAGAASNGVQHSLRLPRHGFSVFNQRHVGAHQRLQMVADERVATPSGQVSILLASQRGNQIPSRA